MSSLCRFKTGDVWYKARIFERASRKRECSCCQQTNFGVLVRHKDPVKKDTLICDECIIKLSLGMRIDVPGDPNVMFGIYPRKAHVVGKKRGPNRRKGRKKGLELTSEQLVRFRERLRATRAKTKARKEAEAIEEVREEVVEEPIELHPIPLPKSDYGLNKRPINAQK